jgi:hypothetical protein
VANFCLKTSLSFSHIFFLRCQRYIKKEEKEGRNLTFSRKIVDVFVAFLWDGHFNMQILFLLNTDLDPALYK